MLSAAAVKLLLTAAAVIIAAAPFPQFHRRGGRGFVYAEELAQIFATASTGGTTRIPLPLPQMVLERNPLGGSNVEGGLVDHGQAQVVTQVFPPTSGGGR